MLCAANSGSVSHTALQHTNCAFAEEKFSLNRKKEVTSCFCLPLTAEYGTASSPQLFHPDISDFHKAFLSFETFHLSLIMFSLPQVSSGLFSPSEEFSSSSLLAALSELHN